MAAFQPRLNSFGLLFIVGSRHAPLHRRLGHPLISDADATDIDEFASKPTGDRQPGGEALLKFAGRDATQAIKNQKAHKSVPTFIRRILAEHFIGDLVTEGN